jgi:hypothetical protein
VKRSPAFPVLRKNGVFTAIGLFLLLIGCRPAIAADTIAVAVPTKTDTPTATATVPTCTPTRTPRPTRTPTETETPFCKYSGPPAAFEPVAVPRLLEMTDIAIFHQTSQKTETDLYLFESYGGASFGYVTKLHSACREQIPNPDVQSYCKFERETSLIRVTSGEVQGTPELVINESYVHGREGWIRMQGGSWTLSWRLTDEDLEKVKDAFRLSPFYFEKKSGCVLAHEDPALVPVCFTVDIPKVLEMVNGTEVDFVECVVDSQGVVWIDPQTYLPRRLTVEFNVGVFFTGQEGKLAYNVYLVMDEKYLAYNERYSYPNV